MKRDAISYFNKKNKSLTKPQRGLPDVGENEYSEKRFSQEIMDIYQGFKVYGKEIYELDKEMDQTMPKISLGGGSPGKFKPFPLCLKYIKKSFRIHNYSEYPLAAGDPEYRKLIAEYLKSDGYISKKESDNLKEDNIIFTTSTTQAFNYIVQVIAKPNDVIIMTGPNYGLFSFVPERHGVTVVMLPLKKENGFYPDPKDLEKLIIEINDKLKKKFAQNDRCPKVIAYLNMNPHNPLGTVIDESKKELLEELGNVCKANEVFVIDDLLYRDLSFDKNKTAKPMGSIEGMFDNTISIVGLSKSYGLAALRAGFIVANPNIIRGIRNVIFQQTDSTPLLQASALAGAYNNSSKRKKIYDKYFHNVRKVYYKRFCLLKTLINGIDSIDQTFRQITIKTIKKYSKDNWKDLLAGIPGVKFVENLDIKAGFFALIDFTGLKGKKYKEFVINDEFSLLKFLYKYGRIKFILGRSIGWPDKRQLIGRFTFALEEDELVRAISTLAKLIKELK